MKDQKLTAKQVTAKVNNLLKGIDNSAAVIDKHRNLIQTSVNTVNELFSGLSNELSTAPKAPEAEKPAKPQKAEKVVKTEKVVKAAPVKKNDSNKKDRPSCKEIAVQVITTAKKAVTAAEIYKTGTAKYGNFSSQSLYNALKDQKVFRKTESGYELVNGKTDSNDEVDSFVKQVESDSSVSAVV